MPDPTPSSKSTRLKGFDASLRSRWIEAPHAPVDGDFLHEAFLIPDGWLQGRSLFGGLTAAALAALASKHVDAGRTLRSASIQLLRPTRPGPAMGKLRIVREGRTTTFAQAILVQHDEETALASFVFTAPHPTATAIAGPPAFVGPTADSLEDLSYVPGLFPEFTQHVAMRWAQGAPPYSGAETAHFDGYCRFRIPAGGAEGVLGLLDMWPCPSLSVLREPRAASTVTWSAHIAAIPANFEQWFSFSYDTIVGTEGFHVAAGHLHAADGTYVGFTEQLVAIFE